MTENKNELKKHDNKKLIDITLVFYQPKQHLLLILIFHQERHIFVLRVTLIYTS
jgi:hypothetical protein